MFGLMEWIRSKLIVDRAIRAEIFALGGRHLGEVLAGAKAELAESGLDPSRRALLRAVIRRQGQLAPQASK
jgi:hypothetical protein